MHNRLTVCFLTLVACLAMASMAFAQTCQDVHGPGTSGCAPSPLDGTEITLTGVVYVLPGTYNAGAMYFQCAGGLGGMTIYDASLVLALGDQISVTGLVGAFGSEIQFSSGVVTVLSSGNPEIVQPIGSGDLADGTDQLGGLMSVQGTLAKVSGGFNSTYTVDDGSGPVICFMDGTTGITEADLDSYLGDIVKLTGSTKCYNGEGELLPRSVGDIELITIPVPEQAWGALKAQFK